MICETCHGRSYLSHPFIEYAYEGMPVWREVRKPCPNPLCHNGHVACCDGLQEQSDDKEAM